MILPLLGPFALLFACYALFRMCIRFGTLSVKPTRIKCVRDVEKFSGKGEGR